MNPRDPVSVLAELVRAKSLSGQEEPALAVIEAVLEAHGVAFERMGRNLIARHGKGEPVVWLNSHLDTVEPAQGYTYDPWSGEVTGDGRVLGLGANDAKGSVVALTFAFLAIRETLPEPAGTLMLVASCEEEAGRLGMEWLRTTLPKPDAAIIGEPNAMKVANCCKGLMRAEVVAVGRSAHASRPWQGVNAMRVAMPALMMLCMDHHLPLDPILGPSTHEVTMVRGGHQKNALPDRVDITVDLRTTPSFDNHAMAEHLHRLIDPIPGCEVIVISDRLNATATPSDGRLVQAALAARRQLMPAAFMGVCDFCHVGDCDAIVMGPGDPPRSHRADEFLTIEELELGVQGYTETLLGYFAGS